MCGQRRISQGCSSCHKLAFIMLVWRCIARHAPGSSMTILPGPRVRHDTAEPDPGGSYRHEGYYMLDNETATCGNQSNFDAELDPHRSSGQNRRQPCKFFALAKALEQSLYWEVFFGLLITGSHFHTPNFFRTLASCLLWSPASTRHRRRGHL